MKKFVLSKKLWVAIIVVTLATGWFYLKGSTGVIPDSVETGKVERGEVVEIVSETGHVKAAQSVNMAFERGGRVAEILVQEGSKVKAGDVLVKLDTAVASAELTSASARLTAEKARLQELINGTDDNTLAVSKSAVTSAEIALTNAKRNLTEVTAQQNQLVLNIEKTLRTSDLQAYLVGGLQENSLSSYKAPIVSGVYDSNEEGLYTVKLYNSSSPSGSSYSVGGLEGGSAMVSTISPTPLGTRGLFLQFPDNFAKNTTWEIPIPNTRSSLYSTNQNAYKAVVDGRAIAIATAENAVKTAEGALKQSQSQLTQISGSTRDEKLSAQRAVVLQMQAAVDAAQVQLDNMTLVAPFSGIVTNTYTEVGQIIGATAPAVSLISVGQYELTVAISEVDIAELSIDDPAEVKFDAYDGVTFKAHVVRIAPSAELVDGVRVFTVTLMFDEEDTLIRDGLSADIDITTAKKENVISIPTRAIYEDKTGKFVRVVSGDTVSSTYITTGLRGSDGNSEVLTGLSGGETIITFADEDALKQIKSK